MQLLGALVYLSRFIGFLGIVLGLYVYAKTRDLWTVVATLSSAIGFLVPFFGVDVPLYRVFYPYSAHGVVISLLLTVGPWFHLLPRVVAPRKRRRKAAGSR